jgi:hypothetical protein
MRTIDMTPTFRETATMLCVILESGSDEGREFARAELQRWGMMLDGMAAANAARDLAQAG